MEALFGGSIIKKNPREQVFTDVKPVHIKQQPLMHAYLKNPTSSELYEIYSDEKFKKQAKICSTRLKLKEENIRKQQQDYSDMIIEKNESTSEIKMDPEIKIPLDMQLFGSELTHGIPPPQFIVDKRIKLIEAYEKKKQVPKQTSYVKIKEEVDQQLEKSNQDFIRLPSRSSPKPRQSVIPPRQLALSGTLNLTSTRTGSPLRSNIPKNDELTVRSNFIEITNLSPTKTMKIGLRSPKKLSPIQSRMKRDSRPFSSFNITDIND